MEVINFILADIRIQIVVSLVIFAILIALFLTYLEFRAKAKRNKKKVIAAKEYFIRKLQKNIKSKKTPREKLDLLDKTAKDYFHKNLQTQIGDNYSSLVKFFEKKKLEKQAYFSRSMFDAYYSMNDLNESIVDSLAKIFVEIYREAENEKSPAENPLKEKIEKIIYKEESSKKGKGIFEYVSIGTSKFFGFFGRKLGNLISFFFSSREEPPTREWAENFEDVDKEKIIRNLEEEDSFRVKHSLVLKEKEIAQRKLDELKKKHHLNQEEKTKVKEFESFLKRNKKEDHFTFYGQ